MVYEYTDPRVLGCHSKGLGVWLSEEGEGAGPNRLVEGDN